VFNLINCYCISATAAWPWRALDGAGADRPGWLENLPLFSMEIFEDIFESSFKVY
jgi:hypothetical protein